MPLDRTLQEEFTAIAQGRVRFNEPMRLHTTFHIGGPAEIWTEPQSVAELQGLLKTSRDAGIGVTVIGGGANLLVRDEGIPGLVIHLGHSGFQGCVLSLEGLTVGAGLPLEWLIRRSEQAGLSGVEFLAGVPGRMGGAVWMNAGTHDDEGKLHSTSDVVQSLKVIDLEGTVSLLPAAEAGFGYRSSRMDGRIVLEAHLRLMPDDKQAISSRVKRLWEFKKRTQDWSAPSAGCIFKNPAGRKAAGWLVDRAGLKGFSVGGAMVSKIHSNFMVNTGGAKAADVLALIEEVKGRVFRRFGIELELEVQLLPKEGPVRETVNKGNSGGRRESAAAEGLIGVLCGGPSAEREISLRSGKAVYEALRSKGLPVSLVVLSENLSRISQELKDSGISRAFIALHGSFGEDGTIQALLENLGIPYTGSEVEASRYAMDKIAARRRWIAAKLPVPHLILAEPVNAVTRAREMKFPLMVKPVAQGSSFGMSIVDSAEQLPAAAQKAGEYGEEIILEEYLPGPELTVSILDGKPLPVIQIVPKNRFYDYEAKYTPGMTEYRVPAPLSEADTRSIQELALKAHQALGCGSYSRVDLILVPDRGPVLLEINTIPGMTETSLLPKAAAAAGISFPELCARILESAVRKGPLKWPQTAERR